MSRLGKRRSTSTFRFEVDDSTAAAEAVAAADMLVLRAGADPDAQAAAARVREQAGAAYDACFGTITFRAVGPAVQDELEQEGAEREARFVEVHARQLEQAREAGLPAPERHDPPSRWDADSYEVRLIAAHDAERRPPQQWADELDDDWSLADRMALLAACFEAASHKSYDTAAVGKGWAASRS